MPAYNFMPQFASLVELEKTLDNTPNWRIVTHIAAIAANLSPG